MINGAPSLIPASIRLANAETELVSPFGVATVLKEKIASLRERFDFILIDCPPTLSLLTVNALTASNAVVIPCKTDYLSIMGIPLLMETIENVRRRANTGLKIVGILPTLFNARAASKSLSRSTVLRCLTRPMSNPKPRSNSFLIRRGLSNTRS